MDGTHFEEFEPERLVKSSQRVRDLGEVFTPGNTVDDMLDLLPSEMWEVHPARKFLEPSVGNGNFVSAILSRKLTFVDRALAEKVLPAGNSTPGAEFHALEALSSIYGVDISEDNIIGGTPGHEVACRPRLLTIMSRWHESIAKSETSEDSDLMKSAAWIVAHNIIIGNMLKTDALGQRTGREEMLLYEYSWNAREQKVTILKTTFGAVIDEQSEIAGGYTTLFGPEPPVEIWSGRFDKMYECESNAVTELTGTSMTNARGMK
jgi:hypothetical protein